MAQRIYFKCYQCKQRFYGKTALSMWNGHLHCSGCIKALSKAVPEQKQAGHYNVIYISRAGTRLGATLSASTFRSQEEAEAYVLKRKHAREILLTTYYDEERENDMTILVDGKPLTILTNQGCENTGLWSAKQFEHYSLEWGEWDGKAYPLTDDEAIYISYENRVTPAGGDLMFGYSALYEGKKWAMPSIEYMHPVDGPVQEEEQRLLERLVAPYLGRVVIDEEGPDDRLTVLILVPFSALQDAFNDVHDWQRYLERGLGIDGGE